MGEMTHEWVRTADPIIPKITDEELLSRAARFELIHKDDRGEWRAVVAPKDAEWLRKTSCIWSPEFGEHRYFGGESKAVPFFVTCGYYGFFKPSIAEVLSQAPVDELTRLGLNAFFIGDHVEILRSGLYQRATAYFVGAREPSNG